MNRLNRWLKGVLCAVLLPAFLHLSTAWAQPYLPYLHIAESNGTVTVSWPRWAYYYTLLTKTDLSTPDLWTGVATAAGDFRSEAYFPEAQITTNASAYGFDFSTAVVNQQSFYGMVGPHRIPAFRFAIFYQGLLEFSTAALLTVNGPVHGNADIYTGTSAALTFNSPVTTSGTVGSPAWNGQGPSWNDTGTFNGNPPSVPNVAPLYVLVGTNTSDSHPFITNLHSLIDIPPNGEDAASLIGETHLYNKAQVVVIVTNASTTVRLQTSAVDPAPVVITMANTNDSFLKVTNTFTDQRENKFVRTTQIDLGLYRAWLSTNPSVVAKFPPGSGSYPTVLYIADTRSNSGTNMSAVRIADGITLPFNDGHGFTLVTPNPLYVWGNYNCTNAAQLGTTNTVSTVPAALMCDALTILSAAWKDSLSAGSLPSRTASSAITINAAIVAGNVPSTGPNSTQFSGGVHNLPRLLENWGASTLWLNTSLVCLYQSKTATNQYQNPGVYFNAPTRKFNLDRNFLDPAKIPTGCPMVGVLGPDVKPY